MADGNGCTCYARSQGECACDADWTPQIVYDLQAQLTREWEQNEALKTLLREAGCPKKEDLLAPCENGLLRTSVMNSECLRCPWCAKRDQLLKGEE